MQAASHQFPFFFFFFREGSIRGVEAHGGKQGRGFSLASPQGFKTRLVGRGFHILIRNALFLSPTDMGSHNPLLLGPECSLAHHLVSDSDSIRNSSSPDNPFGAFSRGFKTHMLGRGFHTLVRYVSFPSPTDVGSHNPLPLGASVLAGTPSGVWL